LRAAFEALLRSELILEISGNGDLKVKEDDASAALKDLLIQRVPPGSVAFELDHAPKGELKRRLKNAFSQLSCLINGEHAKANKSCDFVIVSPGVERSKVILGDLKSKNPKKSDCSAQLRNSEIFIEFIFRLLAEYHGQTVVPEFRKVVFFVVEPIKVKLPTQLRNSRPPEVHDGVTYFPVVLGGRNNSHATVAYPLFS
jgi:hypothetical protein